MITLIDFYTTHCPPCRAMAPHIETIARELTGKIQVIKYNLDQYPQYTRQYNITSVPTLILFRDGIEVKRRIGGGTRNDILSFLKNYY